MHQRIQGRQGGPKIHHLKINDEFVTHVQDIVDSRARVLVPKPGKEAFDPSNYRPIALAYAKLWS